MKSQDIDESISSRIPTANQASTEYWHRLEKLMNEAAPGKVVRKPDRHRELKTFASGVLAATTMFTIIQGGLSAYDAGVQRSLLIGQSAESLQLPFASEMKTMTAPFETAMTRMTVSAQNSTITAVVDPNTLTSSLYWTLALKNTSGKDQEAQAELKLPEGAVISRATLWINGVPQEAAFNTTAKVETAYNWITQKHRDPLLVTYKDDGTVLIKASPVPANGDIMKIRLGITAPMTVGTEGQGVLTVPEIIEANFTLAEKNDLHIESRLPIKVNDSILKAERTATGKYLLKGNLKADELGKVAILAPEAGLNGDFAVRATHSLPGTYIFAKLNNSAEEEVSLSRQNNEPDCRMVTSEAAAHRVSTLWAAGQIKNLLAQGKRSEAENLASVYRIVSPVSGAVVLEYDSDYQYQGLNRDQYMLAVDGKNPIPSRFSGFGTGSAPILQGATNGTIGPQGQDAFAVQGINTAGTVRVNNLANLEVLFNILATACNFAFLSAAFFIALRGIGKIASGQLRTGVKDEYIALSLVFFGTLWLIASPFIAGWKLCRRYGAKQPT